MKKYLTSVAILLGLVVASCSTTEPAATAIPAERVVYQVFGMDCPGCHGGLEKNVEKIPSVAKATANWKEQIVTITLQPGQSLDVSALEKAVTDSNFTLGKRVN